MLWLWPIFHPFVGVRCQVNFPRRAAQCRHHENWHVSTPGRSTGPTLARCVPDTSVSLASAIAHGRHLPNRFRLLNSFSVFANQIEVARQTPPLTSSPGVLACLHRARDALSSTWAAHEQGASFRSDPRFHEQSSNATTNKQISRWSAR